MRKVLSVPLASRDPKRFRQRIEEPHSSAGTMVNQRRSPSRSQQKQPDQS